LRSSYRRHSRRCKSQQNSGREGSEFELNEMREELAKERLSGLNLAAASLTEQVNTTS
jgi:hypothetical protein